MNHAYTCPCCGYHFRFSPEFVQTVVDTVARYFRVRPENILRHKTDRNSPMSRPQAFAVYFIRQMSGEIFKLIDGAFGWKAEGVTSGGKYAKLLVLAEGDEFVRGQIAELEPLVIEALKEKINPCAISA
jgi:hypothetical protein